MPKRKGSFDTTIMIPIAEIAGSGIEYEEEVEKLSSEAIAFLKNNGWASGILNGWLDWSYGYILGIFYFRVTPASPDSSDCVWAVVGDLPPACYSAEGLRDRKAVIQRYLQDMQDWIDCSMKGEQADSSMTPVNVPQNKEWASILQKRVDFIRREFIDFF